MVVSTKSFDIFNCLFVWNTCCTDSSVQFLLKIMLCLSLLIHLWSRSDSHILLVNHLLYSSSWYGMLVHHSSILLLVYIALRPWRCSSCSLCHMLLHKSLLLMSSMLLKLLSSKLTHLMLGRHLKL